MSENSQKSVDVSRLADIALVGTYNGLDARLREVSFDWSTDGLKAEGSFYYLAFKDGMPTQEDFLTFVYWKTLPFCLSRSYLRECHEHLAETKDERYLLEPADRAKSLFIKAKKKNKRSGEPGEVVLFALLEGYLNAPRIVSKMNLKTNRNMEVHGSDAIHIKFDTASETLYLYWGEAKLYKDLANALGQIADSIKAFCEVDNARGDSQRSFDINLVQSHPDLDDDSVVNALSAYFDPYTEYANQVREIHACLALWDWSVYEEVGQEDPEKAEEVFRGRYVKRIESACKLFADKLQKQGLERLRFHFFLLPLCDVQSFRRQFFAKMGVPIGDE